MLLVMAFLSFISVTFMVEAMSLGNAYRTRNDGQVKNINSQETAPLICKWKKWKEGEGMSYSVFAAYPLTILYFSL